MRRSFHTGEVEGSIPSAPTTKSSINMGFLSLLRIHPETFRDGTRHEHDAPIRVKSGGTVPRPFSVTLERNR